jgi:hypothetical protein
VRLEPPVRAAALGLVLGALPACGARERGFDGERAYAALVAQVELGPRVPGTDAHRRGLEYLQRELKPLADRVSLHSFDGVCALDSSRVRFHNVVAVFHPESRRRILFGAHWDSRPFADEDPDPANRTRPVPGANDGASGVAVLLEVARALEARPPRIGVDLVFFDGEDCGRPSEPAGFALGSRQFVADHPGYRPGYAVVLDMVGRTGTRIPREGNSVAAAPQLVEAIWSVAREKGLSVLSDSLGPPWMDDHIAFLAAGIPAVDLIDAADPAWHTVADLPGNCSPATLAEVGRLLLALIERAEDAEGSGFPP